MDALHCNPIRLGSSMSWGDLLGWKHSQKKSLSECIDMVRFSKLTFNFIQAEFGLDANIKAKHGFIKKREYDIYDISKKKRMRASFRSVEKLRN
jgi:hypothetical protein